MSQPQNIRRKIGDNKLLHVIVFSTAMLSIFLQSSIALHSGISVSGNQHVVMNLDIEPVVQHAIVHKKRPPRRLRFRYIGQSFDN